MSCWLTDGEWGQGPREWNYAPRLDNGTERTAHPPVVGSSISARGHPLFLSFSLLFSLLAMCGWNNPSAQWAHRPMKSRHNLLHTWLRPHKRSLALKTRLSPWWTRIKGFFFSSFSFLIVYYFSLFFFLFFLPSILYTSSVFSLSSYSILIMEFRVEQLRQPTRCLYKLIRWENSPLSPPTEREKKKKRRRERRRTIILLLLLQAERL